LVEHGSHESNNILGRLSGNILSYPEEDLVG